MLRAAVCRNLGRNFATRLRWSTSKVPTIDNIKTLADCPLFAGGLGAADSATTSLVDRAAISLTDGAANPRVNLRPGADALPHAAPCGVASPSDATLSASPAGAYGGKPAPGRSAVDQ